MGGGRHFNMRNVLLPQEGIRVVKQAPLRPWTPVWFQFVGQEGEEEGEAAPLAGHTVKKTLITWRHTRDLHVPWNAFDMLWFRERDEALHTENRPERDGGGRERRRGGERKGKTDEVTADR